MSGPYRPSPEPTAAPSPAPSGRGSAARSLLWVLLVLSIAGNSLGSAGVLPLAVGIACGLGTVGCVTALVLRRLRCR